MTRRSVLAATHLVHTPESFVRTPLAGLVDGLAIIHASPELGARFVWMTVEMQAGGRLCGSEHSRFFYVLEGAGRVRGGEMDTRLETGGFAYSPPGMGLELAAETRLRCVVIDKRYEGLGRGSEPKAFAGREEDVAPQPLEGSTGIEVRALMPAGLEYDFAVNTMTYAAGAALGQVEVHYMEHGLLMLEGTGPYRLSDATIPVAAGDFIWMAPYCPQWFAADAGGPAKYLIYKNFNRMPAL